MLRSKGIRAGQRQIAEVLPSVCRHYHQQRLNRAEQQINPIPYTASYFGHKLHIDQNEKLVMFGVTQITAVDGFSNMVVGFVTMPVKNNVEIYKELFSPIVMNYGLWDQLRVDHGKEWVLTLYVQELLAHLRTNQSRALHSQTSSKQVIRNVIIIAWFCGFTVYLIGPCISTTTAYISLPAHHANYIICNCIIY